MKSPLRVLIEYESIIVVCVGSIVLYVQGHDAVFSSMYNLQPELSPIHLL